MRVPSRIPWNWPKQAREMARAMRAMLMARPAHVMVYEITGPMFFGAVEKIPHLAAGEKRRVMILRMRSVPALDLTALNGLRRLWEECRSRNIRLLFSHLNPQPLSVLEKSGLYAEIGPESFLPNIDEALALAQEL